MKYTEKLSNFVLRALGYFNFFVHKSTVLPTIPSNRKEMGISDVLLTKLRFNDEHVDVFIAADETFMSFHKALSTVVAPK